MSRLDRRIGNVVDSIGTFKKSLDDQPSLGTPRIISGNATLRPGSIALLETTAANRIAYLPDDVPLGEALSVVNYGTGTITTQCPPGSKFISGATTDSMLIAYMAKTYTKVATGLYIDLTVQQSQGFTTTGDITILSDTGRFIAGAGGSVDSRIGFDGSDLIFYTIGDYFFDGGRVGIRTNSPDNELTVAGIADADHFLATQPTKRMQFCDSDFLFTSNVMNPPWVGASINSGTQGGNAGDQDNPGRIVFQSSASANSGYRYVTGAAGWVLGGGETSEVVWNNAGGLSATTTVRMGYHDTATSAAPTDGVWIEYNNATLTGETSAGGSGSTTGSNYTITNATVYRSKIFLNSDATLATFQLYSAAGSLLWSDTLATNIPTAATGNGIVATNSATSARNLFQVDYICAYIDRNLARGYN